MSTAILAPTIPDDTIPASRLMRERDEHREAWAREYTRANTLEAALDRAQQATADWQAIAITNGEEAARARVTAARDEAVMKRLIGELADEKHRNGQLIAENVRLLAKLEAVQKRLDAFIDDTLTLDSSTIAEYAAGPCGIDCPECEDGRVETFDDVWVGGNHSTRDYTVECGNCGGTGRSLR